MVTLKLDAFDEFYTILCEAFPFEERRDYEGQKALFQRDDYHVYAFMEHQTIQCILAVYELKEICFIEHLATIAKCRGSGVGKQLLCEYLQARKTPVLLEVEPIADELTRRRIRFYERLGFHLYDDFGYVQPSFHLNVKPLPLRLMSWPQRLDQRNLKHLAQRLYQEIYHQDLPVSL